MAEHELHTILNDDGISQQQEGEVSTRAPPDPTIPTNEPIDFEHQSIRQSSEGNSNVSADMFKSLEVDARIETLEKRFKYAGVCMTFLTLLLIVVLVVSISALSQPQHNGEKASANTGSGGGIHGAAATVGGMNIPSVSTTTTANPTTASDAPFTSAQWALINKTLSTLTGPPGKDGQDGKPGLNGTNGKNGRDGINGGSGTNGTCIGVLGFNRNVTINGYYGWYYQWNFKWLYPFADIYAKVGDNLIFRGAQWMYPNRVGHVRDDVVLMNDFHSWNTCNLTTGNFIPLATFQDLRHNGGFMYNLAQHYEGKTLLFTSRRDSHSSDRSRWSCVRGIKVRVHVAPRLEVPIRNADGNDQADSQTVLKLRNTVAQLSRLSVLQQLQLEQRIRSQGHSGLTDSRGGAKGMKPYNDGHFAYGGIAAIHNHADFVRTIGMGELQAVLNGVEFATRHNDYSLRMPHRTSTVYHRTENIEFPDVPPEVLNKATVQDQIYEMQEWFRAFKKQDWSVRDYRKYFRPVLCYMEGTWIESTESLNDPFLSDRHKLDAKTWRELHDKMRFFANTGRKNLLENIAFLPHSVRDLLNDTWPIFSNWEYRILCHPLKDDLPLQRLRVVSDLSTQLQSSPITREELGMSRKARYQVNEYTRGSTIPYPTIRNGAQTRIPWSTGRSWWGYLDHLMEQIPGKDNYQANLTDTLAGEIEPAYHFYSNQKGKLNAGYYSRFYSVRKSDAMGASIHRRGYHDQFLWSARTSHKKVSGVGYAEDVKINPTCRSNCKTKTNRVHGRWSYAIPMEIIFLTPLTKWNPYNLTFMSSTQAAAGGRNGGCSPTKAYHGVNDLRLFFMTPSSFFGNGQEGGQGDTVKSGDTCVLDQNGVVRHTRASGHWIIFPKIGNGIGKIRQRYPIMPIHETGSIVYKEMKALQELTLKDDYDRTNAGYFGDSRDEKYGFTLEIDGGGHQHFVTLRWYHVRRWKFGNGSWDTSGSLVVTATSDRRNNHQHSVKVVRVLDGNGKWKYMIKQCKYVGEVNYQNETCADGHSDVFRAI